MIAVAHLVTAIETFPPSEIGALGGYEVSCSCGLTLRSSIRSLLLHDIQAHIAYAASREATAS